MDNIHINKYKFIDFPEFNYYPIKLNAKQKLIVFRSYLLFLFVSKFGYSLAPIKIDMIMKCDHTPPPNNVRNLAANAVYT